VNSIALSAGFCAALMCSLSLGQNAAEGERPPRPDSASNAAIGGWCDALTGEKKEQCLRDERRRQEEKAREGRTTHGSCDALIGPDKQRCLRQGGTVEVDVRGSAGAGGSASAGAREAAKSQ
jgi:hypothetical protein